MRLKYPHSCFSFLLLTALCLCLTNVGAAQAPIRPYGTPPANYEWVRESSLKFTMEPSTATDRNVMWRSYVWVENGTPYNRANAWFTCTLNHRTPANINEYCVVKLDKIGAQARFDTVILRVNPAIIRTTDVEVILRCYRAPRVMVFEQRIDDKWQTILPAYEKNKKPRSGEFAFSYELVFKGTAALDFECFLLERPPTNSHGRELDDGYPPPDTPGDVEPPGEDPGGEFKSAAPTPPSSKKAAKKN